MEQCALKNVNNCLNSSIYSYLKTSGSKSSILYLNVHFFSTPVLIRDLWHFLTVIFPHWCLICVILSDEDRQKVFVPSCLAAEYFS
jgi:hypothetical protein